MTIEELFKYCWDLEVLNRKAQSPSYEVSDYVATGRAAAAYGGKRNEAWWLDHGPAMVQKWIDWREANKWSIWETPEGKPAVELELNVRLPSGKPVKMFIDRVMVTPVGQLTVVDLKSGRIPETAEQLGLYAFGLSQKYGEMFRPDWGYFWNPDKGHGSPLDLSLYTGAYLDEIAAGAVAGINAGSFLAKPANNCKNWCGVAQFCPAVGGTMPNFQTRK
jgi:RecB family exonuclease